MGRQVLGSYPVPPENYIWWKNRWQVPGGEIRQQVSPFQLKIMWQYFYNNPSKWYWRFSNWMWPVFMPALMFLVLWQKVKADAEEKFVSIHGTRRKERLLRHRHPAVASPLMQCSKICTTRSDMRSDSHSAISKMLDSQM